MQAHHASSWVRWAFHAAAAYGGIGIFVLAFLDSTFLSFPFLVDILIIHASITKPEWMPLYVGVATVGSLGGCLLLYYLAKAGGDAFFKRYARHFGKQAEQIVKKHTIWGMAIPALLPPPFPFEVFTIASGVFGAPLGEFIAGVVIGRLARFLLEGLLALKYGRTISRVVLRHQDGLAIAFIVLGILGAIALLVYSRYEKRTRGQAKAVAH